MDSTMLWALILTCGLFTFLTRFLPLAGLLPKKLHPLVEQAMHYVPIAVLTPIIIYSVFLPTGEVALINNMRIPAALLALIATILTGRVIVTIVVGMASLWALEYFFI